MALIELNFLKKYALKLGKDIGLNLMHWAQMEIMCMFLLVQHRDMHHSELCRIIKSVTAKTIFKKYPGIKKQLWGGILE